MKSGNASRTDKYLFFLALALIVYMPLHVLIVQSASLLTGGLDVWKAAKDVLIVGLVPLLVFFSYRRGLFSNKSFRLLMILGGLYALVHGLFVLFDQNDDTYSAIVGSVYNTRLFGYLLLGYLVGSAKNGSKYLKILVTTAVVVATVVAVFAILQYFLPKDILTHVGYSLDRGVKPLFFIDDKPDLPRVMSTLKDPNSLGAYLILPIIVTGYAICDKRAARSLLSYEIKRAALLAMLILQLSALWLTFSRGALIGLIISSVTILYIVTGDRAVSLIKRYWYIFVVSLALMAGLLYQVQNTYLVQNIVFHADESTVLADPNEIRVSLTQDAVSEIIASPVGSGPGSAGLVAISNPKGGVLTENYYLQVAYEVGWIGIALFVAILTVVIKQQLRLSRKLKNTLTNDVSIILLSTLAGYIFYSLLIHLWSNEAITLQWWLLAGAISGLGAHLQTKSK